VAQRVGRGIALLFHDRGTRRGGVVSSMPWPHLTPRKYPVLILQETGWAPGPVWTGGKSRPHRDSIPDCPAHSQSLFRLSYPAHLLVAVRLYNTWVLWSVIIIVAILITMLMPNVLAKKGLTLWRRNYFFNFSTHYI
jgi:hypothetical protein